MFVDSHTHLNFEDFGQDMEQVIANARAAGVSTLLTICTKIEEILELRGIIAAHDHIYCTAGVHPHEAEPTLATYGLVGIQENLRAACQDAKVIGIGEAGLDFYYEHSPKQAQRDVFQAQIGVAKELDLPMSIHTRDAEEETIAMIAANPGVRGVIHCFSGTSYLATEALKLGFYISLSGIITFKKAVELREIVRGLPLDRILLETDAPYLAPVPHRGQRNEPAMMLETAKVVAELKGMTMEDLAHQTTKNFFTLFNKAKVTSLHV
ncbi:MAG: TatD family hydrolase [Holosporales bacterium]